jgi:hypothetical protein
MHKYYLAYYLMCQMFIEETLPCLSLSPLSLSLTHTHTYTRPKLALLQTILNEEERLAFLKSVGKGGGGGTELHQDAQKSVGPPAHSERAQGPCPPVTCHPLVAVHNQAVYQKSLVRLLEVLRSVLKSPLISELIQDL